MSDLVQYQAELVQTRRAIHRYPEVAWTEFVTTERVIKRVRELGFKTIVGPALFDPKFAFDRHDDVIEAAQKRALEHGVDPEILQEMGGFTGCLAIWETGREGPVTAFRFDMDCVNVQETSDPEHVPNKEGFCSQNAGLMHSCGHDCHTSVGLTLAHWIADHADQLCGTIKIIYQPAEEGTKGACGIAHSGVLDDVNYFVGSHVGCGTQEHGICAVTGGFLATSKLDVTFEGHGIHAAYPERGRNALMAACTSAVQLMAIARSSEGNSNINIGTLHAGTGRNVIASHASMLMEVRGETGEINEYMQESAIRVIEGVSACYGVKCKIDIVGSATNIASDPEVTDAIISAAQNVPEIESIGTRHMRSGSEDCSFLMRRIQDHGGKAGFFLFGGNHHDHHQKDFDIYEDTAMLEALGVFCNLLKHYNMN